MADKELTKNRQRLSRLAVALAGFLIFLGILMIGVFAIALFGIIDVGVLERLAENDWHRTLFLGGLLAIGILDVAAGIILRPR